MADSLYLVDSVAWNRAFFAALEGSAAAVTKTGLLPKHFVHSAEQIANEAVKALHPQEGYPGDHG